MRRRPRRAAHQVDGLNRLMGGRGRQHQAANRARFRAAIRIDHDDPIGRICREALQPVRNGKSLAALVCGATFVNCRAGPPRQVRCCIDAIVGNHANSVARLHLRQYAPQGVFDDRFLIMRRNEHGQTPGRVASRRIRRVRNESQFVLRWREGSGNSAARHSSESIAHGMHSRTATIQSNNSKNAMRISKVLAATRIRPPQSAIDLSQYSHQGSMQFRQVMHYRGARRNVASVGGPEHDAVRPRGQQFDIHRLAAARTGEQNHAVTAAQFLDELAHPLRAISLTR